MRRISVIFASGLFGFAFLFMPVWFWFLMHWAPMEMVMLSGLIGLSVGALVQMRSRFLHRTGIVLLFLWLLAYAFALIRILPHCMMENGAFMCVNHYF